MDFLMVVRLVTEGSYMCYLQLAHGVMGEGGDRAATCYKHVYFQYLTPSTYLE